MSLKLFLFWSILALASTPVSRAHARPLKDIKIDVTTDKQGGEAKQEAFDKATEQATLQLVQNIMGADKAAKEWPTLKDKLLANSGRFILYIKGAPAVVQNGMTRVSVELRLSQDNLETVMREQGYLSDGTVRLLPLIQIVGTGGEMYSWWTNPKEKGKGDLNESLFRRFVATLTAKAKAKNVFTMDPTLESFRIGVPASFRSPTLRSQDQIELARYFKADVVISGRIVIQNPEANSPKLKLKYDLQLWQVRSGRSIAEAQRSETLVSASPKIVLALSDEITPSLTTQLVSRLADVMASGNLNLNLIRISVSGDLNFAQEDALKKDLMNLNQVRVLRERLFAPHSVVFEAETPSTGSALAQEIEHAGLPQFQVRVHDTQDDRLALQVRALSAASAH